ncbi:hypothetical protein AB7714_06195 [Tardiphaga sp. 1201_B9_N1_1]|uniref:hypothetical protein n=1 Tax=unclassified Tardiphaga TaxID=2631404 RepID=UPI003F29590C
MAWIQALLNQAENRWIVQQHFDGTLGKLDDARAIDGEIATLVGVAVDPDINVLQSSGQWLAHPRVNSRCSSDKIPISTRILQYRVALASRAREARPLGSIRILEVETELRATIGSGVALESLPISQPIVS